MRTSLSHPLAIVLLATTDPVTSEVLRREVSAVVEAAGLTLDEFLDSDIDDLATDELRDLWLMVRGPLLAAS